jgi:hypothetical protein
MVFGREPRSEDIVRRRQGFDNIYALVSSVRGRNESNKYETRWIEIGRVHTSRDVGEWLSRTKEDALPRREIDHLQEEHAVGGQLQFDLFRIGVHDALNEGFGGLRRGVVDTVLYDGGISQCEQLG